MRLLDVSLHTPPGAVRLVGTVERGEPRERTEIVFEFPERFRPFVDVSADPFAVAMLLPAAHAGEPLEIDPPISPRLHFSLPRILEIWHNWDPGFARVPVVAEPRDEPAAPPAGRAATFFSGGVDSFYSLLKRLRPEEALPASLTHVVFMRGIETRLERSEGVDDSLRRVQEVADTVGVECITGTSTLRTFTRLHWENRYLGAGLAATALALAGGFDYVCVPSGHEYSELTPRGSSPLVDEKYSTERLTVVHDGAEVSRVEKLARAVEWDRDLVLDHLRVCTKNRGGDYNCGRCYKCVRTAIPLKILGAWEDARMFPDKSTDRWEEVVGEDQGPYTRENLGFARERGADPELTAMLARVVRRKRSREALKTLAQNSPLEYVVPVVRAVRRRLG
ncbi:hypothetical protein [Rubrivirga sp.]|uniref:hypothetical protein n=1 Tax=Rubrivirga sp. TaxID=1885344 RepID=UPI003B51867A